MVIIFYSIVPTVTQPSFTELLVESTAIFQGNEYIFMMEQRILSEVSY